MKRRKYRLSESQSEKNKRKFLSMVLGIPKEQLEEFHVLYPNITFENVEKKIDLYLKESLKEAKKRALKKKIKHLQSKR